MISTRLAGLLLLLALVLICLQLISGIWLFSEKFGLTPGEVYYYFTGDEQRYIMPKSPEGILETAVPHFLAISATIFVYAHFLLFTEVISQEKKQLLVTALFLTAALDILSPFGILYNLEFFAWVKVVAFWGFEILMGLLVYILFQAILQVRQS